jgi:hypothetical protein
MCYNFTSNYSIPSIELSEMSRQFVSLKLLRTLHWLYPVSWHSDRANLSWDSTYRIWWIKTFYFQTVPFCGNLHANILQLLELLSSADVRKSMGIDLFLILVYDETDRLCGLVVRVLPANPEVPGSIPGAARFFWVAVGLKRGSLSPCEDKWGATWKKSSGSGLENWD